MRGCSRWLWKVEWRRDNGRFQWHTLCQTCVATLEKEQEAGEAQIRMCVLDIFMPDEQCMGPSASGTGAHLRAKRGRANGPTRRGTPK